MQHPKEPQCTSGTKCVIESLNPAYTQFTVSYCIWRTHFLLPSFEKILYRINHLYRQMLYAAGAVAQRGTSGGVDLATRRAAGRGSAGKKGPRGFFSRAGKAAALLPPAVFPLWRVPI